MSDNTSKTIIKTHLKQAVAHTEVNIPRKAQPATMAHAIGWEKTLHGVRDEVPSILSGDIPMKHLPCPGYLPPPARAHLRSPAVEHGCTALAVPEGALFGATPPVLLRGQQIEKDINEGLYECGI